MYAPVVHTGGEVKRNSCLTASTNVNMPKGAPLPPLLQLVSNQIPQQSQAAAAAAAIQVLQHDCDDECVLANLRCFVRANQRRGSPKTESVLRYETNLFLAVHECVRARAAQYIVSASLQCVHFFLKLEARYIYPVSFILLQY